MAENTDFTHYGRPAPISLETEGTMYYQVDNGIALDLDYVKITFETSGASGVTTEVINNPSVSAWSYTGLEVGNRYTATLEPVDLTGNVGDPISWSWSVVSNITWLDVTDIAFWTYNNGIMWNGLYWNMNYWNSGDLTTDPGYGTVTWNDNFRPTKVRLTFTGQIANFIISISPGVEILNLGDTVSGQEYDLNWVDNLDILNLHFYAGAAGFTITAIEFGI